MNTDYKSIGNGLIMLLALSMSLLAASTFWEGAQAYATAMWGGAVVVGSLAITQPRLSTILYLVGSVVAVIGALQLAGGGVYSIVLGLGLLLVYRLKAT